ncbi:MAG: hypothetical protein WCP06_06865, partial [Verrucomicrobiota bacterium]
FALDAPPRRRQSAAATANRNFGVRDECCSSVKVVFSANGATPYQPGATPQVFDFRTVQG